MQICMPKHEYEYKFDLGNFLDEIINDKIMPLNAYNKETLKKTVVGTPIFFQSVIADRSPGQLNKLS